MNNPLPTPAPAIAINIFTAVAGGIDALIEYQLAEMQAMSTEATACGWLGNEVYLAQDRTRLIVVTRFESLAARERWAATKRFQQHVQALMPLVADITSVPVTFLAAHGEGAIACVLPHK